jgi:hypothetical protein
MGGQNPFLGALYILVACLSILTVVIMVIFSLKVDESKVEGKW